MRYTNSRRFEWADHICTFACRVHMWWDFDLQMHQYFPNTWNILTSTHGWLAQEVHCGPGAWFPKRPTEQEKEVMSSMGTDGDIDWN